MRVALAGSSGNFGKLALNMLRANGHEVTGIKRDEWDTADLSAYDVCFLSIPVLEIGKYLEKCGKCKVVEISSVKDPVRRFKGRIVSIHPIFGPRSSGDPKFKNIIYIDDLSEEGGESLIGELFPGYRLHHMTADQHDRAMVQVLINPFFMSRIASEISGNDLEFTGPSQDILKQLAAISGSESAGILQDTIRLNPYAKDGLREIVQVARKLENDFSE